MAVDDGCSDEGRHNMTPETKAASIKNKCGLLVASCCETFPNDSGFRSNSQVLGLFFDTAWPVDDEVAKEDDEIPELVSAFPSPESDSESLGSSSRAAYKTAVISRVPITTGRSFLFIWTLNRSSFNTFVSDVSTSLMVL